MIVGRDRDLIGACRAALERYGHHVAAATAAGATEAARSQSPDLVIVDGNDSAALASVVDIEASVSGVPVFVILNREHLADVFETMQNLVQP